MKELKELRLDSNTLILDGHRVMSSIIPQTYKDMDNDIAVKGESVIEGAVYARKLQIESGRLEVKGAMMILDQLIEDSGNSEEIKFHKAVACSNMISMFSNSKKFFCADLNAKQIKLKNTIIAANLFGNDIIIENCIILGGIFATKSLQIKDCVVGTFNSPSVSLDGKIFTLLPSVFSVEPIVYSQSVRLINLTLADWAALMKGQPELPDSGAIELNLQQDTQTVTLTDKEGNAVLWQTYSVAAKVLSADLLDYKKLQNHFLFSVGTLGEQLAKPYMLDQMIPLDLNSISAFFYKILNGEIVPKSLDGKFSFAEIKQHYAE